MSLKIISAGHNAVMCYLPEPVQDDYPMILSHLAHAARQTGALDVVPAYNSLMVVYDEKALVPETLGKELNHALSKISQGVQNNHQKNIIRIPVCYEGKYAPDVAELAESKGLTVADVIAAHTGKQYSVACLGFIPGFAFLGYVDDAIATPRRANPRPSVPAGSVGIAGQQTGVYPADSPGGWNIIGRTPEKLYDPENGIISRFEIGDFVEFYEISQQEFTTWG
ncbi:MAG: 5-oxoprolinase subunit PxpB [Gammaproteobacteria bacterium]|nr:5-oxoprolinase subunit PxpB [Gammaproteobacteria bacterium]